jgi:hypothetical protein
MNVVHEFIWRANPSVRPYGGCGLIVVIDDLGHDFDSLNINGARTGDAFKGSTC